MRRASIVLPACLVAFALVAGGAACDSTLNLGNAADGSTPILGDAADRSTPSILGDAADGSTPDSAPLTCGSTCDRMIVTCGLLSMDKRGECLSECNLKGRPSDLACVAQTACADIPKRCGDVTDGAVSLLDGAVNDFEIRTCQSGCDGSQFFSCINAAELSACRALCTTAPSAKRNAYQACESGAGGDCPRSRDCFDLFMKN